MSLKLDSRLLTLTATLAIFLLGSGVTGLGQTKKLTTAEAKTISESKQQSAATWRARAMLQRVVASRRS
jgi:hypothetical protein